MGRKRFAWVRVVGPSMTPTLRDGDLVLVRLGAAAGPGDVVLARFRSMPDRYVIKRAERRFDDGWWLRGDNRFVEGDSASHGVADVCGRALLRRPKDSVRLRRVR